MSCRACVRAQRATRHTYLYSDIQLTGATACTIQCVQRDLNKGRAPRRVRERAPWARPFLVSIVRYLPTHFALSSRLCILQRHLTPVRQQAPLRVQCDSAVPTVSYLYVCIVRYLHSLRAPLRCLCNNQEKLHLAINIGTFYYLCTR